MDDNQAKAMEVDEPQIDARDEGRRGEEAQNPSPDSPPSSSGSDSDGEAAAESQVLTLESQLKDNPWNYDAHVQYVQSLRKLGQIEKLRRARESMKECFPLAPKMWQEWAKDEASLSTSYEAFTDIEKLYECGVHEYLSVPLWCDYLNFVQEHDQLVSQCAPAGILKMRNLFERAVTAAGLHVTEGNKIWEAYREYEEAIFLTIGDDNNEEKSKQVQRIRTLFHRQLSVPLADMESTLENYKCWETEKHDTSDTNSKEYGIPTQVVSAYEKALNMYNVRRTYEDQLSKSGASDADKLKSLVSYIKFEEAAGDPARVQILYERAVCELPLFSELWLNYTCFLDNTLKVPNIVKDVYSRAVRNCSWVGDLWVHYLLSLERLDGSEEELNSVFERSIQCVFQSFEEYLNLFLTRIDGLRRKIASGLKQDGLNYSLIKDTFQRAADYFSEEMISTNDLLHLYAYWARLEASLGEDIVAACGVWERLIKKSGSILEVWQGYIAMEIGFGHINEARSIYKRCYSKRLAGTGSEDICCLWLRFEREYGTISDFDLAMKKVTPRLEELKLFKAQQESTGGVSVSTKEDNVVKTNVPQKRKMTKASGDKQPPSKRQKEATSKHVEASQVDSKKRAQNAQSVELADKADDTNLPVEKDGNTSNSITDAKSKESKRTLYTDQCTAYISNLSFEAKEEHLREFFTDSRGVTSIRLLRDKFTGKSRGIAYVDFSDEEHLAAAIAKNKQRLLGQKLSIARSDPMQGRKRASGGNSSRGRGRGAPSRNDRGAASKPRNDAGGEKKRDDSEVKLVGRNTFAAPRAVRPLGWTDKTAKPSEGIEKPKSNDEFRSMLLKK